MLFIINFVFASILVIFAPVTGTLDYEVWGKSWGTMVFLQVHILDCTASNTWSHLITCLYRIWQVQVILIKASSRRVMITRETIFLWLGSIYFFMNFWVTWNYNLFPKYKVIIRFTAIKNELVTCVFLWEEFCFVLHPVFLSSDLQCVCAQSDKPLWIFVNIKKHPVLLFFLGAQACVLTFSTVDYASFEDVSKWKEKVIQVMSEQFFDVQINCIAIFISFVNN